jgi:GT2 family glycosyltransferase
MQELQIGESLGLGRGEAAVCIPVYGAYERFAQCLLSVLTHTAAEVPVLVCDDATPDPRLRSLVEQALAERRTGHRVHYLRQPENVGFVANVNAAISAAAPADVVILNSDCVVSEGWFGSLRAAAYSESRVATATALTNAGTIVSVPDRNSPAETLPPDLTVDRVAAGVRAASLRLRPDIPTCIGHCVYMRASAIELVGGFDTAFSPGYEEEVDFSQRCVLHGLRHVLADDVFVFHGHAGSFGDDAEVAALRERHHVMIAHRYPYYDPWCRVVAEDEDSPLARSLSVAARAIRGTSVTVDGRILTHNWTGTQLVTLQAIAAIAEHTRLRVRVLVPPDLGQQARSFLAARPQIELLSPDQVSPGLERTDVVHRPYQVSSVSDLEVLRALGRRIVITQLDNIALRNPGYFASFEAWMDHWRLNQIALGAADQIVFLSVHSAQDAQALAMVPEDRVNVVAPQIAAPDAGIEAAPRPPDGSSGLAERPFLLCLGTDFIHKNRVFALRLLATLIEEHGFDGVLVLAGPKMASGSSAGEEAAYVLAQPELANRVLDLGAVDEAAKAWLLQQATAVVYPTTYEGFGLTPFEAAQLGTPCLFAPVTSLAEVLPEEAALLVPWDPRRSAERCAPVLTDGEARERLVHAINDAGARYTPQNLAAGLEAVYERALLAPPAPTFWSALAQAQRQLDSERERLSAIYGDPLNRGLVGPDALLPAELRRPVLAVATRPALRRAASTLYRAAYALSHGGRRPPRE